MEQEKINASLPLTPKVFHILLALAQEPRNGYQLGLQVEVSTEGSIRMSPGTLYENLHRLDHRGLIRELEEADGGKADGRGQRFYTLTESGLEVLKAEVERLSRDLSLAQSLPAVSS